MILEIEHKTEIYLGKILRIDVDTMTSYNIPSDNPFVNETNVKGEIWSWGLRNPWRYSFDKFTGDMWIGDVGQGDWEEVDLSLLIQLEV
ncbi:MAG: PQQ-dependent sugar dehydrogenase [Chitinophagales bacterium]